MFVFNYFSNFFNIGQGLRFSASILGSGRPEPSALDKNPLCATREASLTSVDTRSCRPRPTLPAHTEAETLGNAWRLFNGFCGRSFISDERRAM